MHAQIWMHSANNAMFACTCMSAQICLHSPNKSMCVYDYACAYTRSSVRPGQVPNRAPSNLTQSSVLHKCAWKPPHNSNAHTLPNPVGRHPRPFKCGSQFECLRSSHSAHTYIPTQQSRWRRSASPVSSRLRLKS